MDEVITDYLAGHTLEYLSDKYGGSVSTIWRRLRNAGVPLRKRGRPARINPADVLAAISGGMTQAEAARHFKVGPSRVWKIVNDAR